MVDLSKINPPPKKARHKTRPGKLDETIDRIVQGDDFVKIMEPLSEEEKIIFWEQIAILRVSGDLSMEDLWKIDYQRKPPTMEEYINDEYWMGNWCVKSEEGTGLYPAWREILLGDFNLDSRIHNAVLTGSLGIGKCWSKGTCMVMLDGSIKAVENIVVGDQLLGDDSTPRTVSSTVKGNGEMFEIYPAKGEPFTVNADHILCLKSSVSDEIIEVSVKDFIQWPRQKKHEARLYRVGCDWVSKKVPIDPYILGLWLGDGHSLQTTFTNMDMELIDEWVGYGMTLGLTLASVLSCGKGTECKSYHLSSFHPGTTRVAPGQNELKNRLKSLGFMSGKFGMEKFIPNNYLINDRKTRISLLAGLLDTDGSKSKGGKRTDQRLEKISNGVYELTVKQKYFSNQIRFLAQSLGYFAQTKVKIVNSTAYYKTVISGAYDVPTLLTHKKSQSRGFTVSPLTGHIRIADCQKTKFAVIPEGLGEYYGFTIDGNQRCLLRDFTVTHNTSIAVFLQLYRVAIARCMRNPQSFLGLGKGSLVLFVLLSVTRSAVEQTAWAEAKNFMSNSPFFKEECLFNPSKKYSGLHIPLGNGLFLTAGSRGQHVLGRNTMGVLLDEGNWRLEANPDLKAYELYNDVRTRLSNRFQKMAGYLPALSLLASSARDESSFTESAIDDIKRVNSPATERVYRFAQFRIKRHELRLSKRWFKIEYGLKSQEPRVLSGWYTEDGKPLKADGMVHEPPNTGAQVEFVPEDFLGTFKRNVKTALQSICGLSTGGSHRLFSSLELVEQAIKNGKAAGLVDPCPVPLISVSEENNHQIWDSLQHKLFLTRRAGRIIPLRDPEALRYAHLDLATTNVAGLSICHAVGTKKIDGIYNRETGNTFSQYRRVVAYDFILAITAGTTKPISVKKIQDFLFWLRDYCGFQWGRITCDSYGAGIPLQPFDARGIPTELLSLDKTKIPYYSWRTGFEEDRILLLPHPILLREIEYLIDHPNGKIDHPEKTPFGEGTKDLTDSAAGAYFSCINDESKSAGNVSPADVTLHVGQETAEIPPVITVTPEPARPVRHYGGV